ncbi:type II toxin-antitoxin system prevent-host-death family antitoxin [Lacticaseibacillus parakribbianus]|uniref:type II toxin-antitoxin system prevent-host-death family antitoxin n=1 Tax=Lacticaseibacillus parakribbianus TaxID=2970927 RepID=UPI0021CB8EDF|nr:type II toxin-antitoxin system prevent-host-death family antitoxin [Lacticaseibacillus parakribbianus]
MQAADQDIRPVSELRRYNELLADVTPDHAITLTKNGYGKYVVMDLSEYQRLMRQALGAELNRMMTQALQEPTRPLADFIAELQAK